MPDNVAVASGASTNSSRTVNTNLRYKKTPFISDLDDIKDVADGADFVLDPIVKSMRSVTIPLVDGSPDERNTVFRAVRVLGRTFTQGSSPRLFKILDAVKPFAAPAKFVGQKILSPFLTGYYVGMLEQDIRANNREGIFMSVNRLVGVFFPVPGYDKFTDSVLLPMFRMPPVSEQGARCGGQADFFLPQPDFSQDFRGLTAPPQPDYWRSGINVEPLP